MSTLTLPSVGRIVPSPRPVRWSCAEFHRFGDMGIFEGRRAMLIDGVILEEGPMIPPHAITLELVEQALRSVFGAGWRIRSQSPLVLGQDIDPEPDFAIIAGAVRGSVGHPTTANLVIEVADSSLAFDTNEKRLLYAKSAIPEYWVVDINNQKLLVYRDPLNGDYTNQKSYNSTEKITPLAASVTIPVADLL